VHRKRGAGQWHYTFAAAGISNDPHTIHTCAHGMSTKTTTSPAPDRVPPCLYKEGVDSRVIRPYMVIIDYIADRVPPCLSCRPNRPDMPGTGGGSLTHRAIISDYYHICTFVLWIAFQGISHSPG